MTDQEFNIYCAEVMNLTVHEYDAYNQTIYVHRAKSDEGVIAKRYTNLNKMAEVFDKLDTNKLTMRFFISINEIGIAQAMREFIESTKS